MRSATPGGGISKDDWRVSIHALLAECDSWIGRAYHFPLSFNPRTPCGVRQWARTFMEVITQFQSTHSLRSATGTCIADSPCLKSFNPRTPCGVRHAPSLISERLSKFQSTHSLRSATKLASSTATKGGVSIHALLAECDNSLTLSNYLSMTFQSTHSLRSATAPDLIHCYSTEQIILCANLPKKTVIARLLFLSIYLSIFYSQCITPIADLPGNSCELEVGAQAMFNSL